MKVDYLIVGQGIAGSVMALTLEQMGKSVAIINQPLLSSSSRIAAGVYNPFNFRKSKPVWEAGNSSSQARLFYQKAEKITGVKFHTRIDIVRLFGSEEERMEWNNYIEKADSGFASAAVEKEKYGAALSPLGYGLLTGSGVLDTRIFIKTVREHYYKRGYYLSEVFDHGKLFSNENSVFYDSRIEAGHVIFCEGHLAKDNPYFDSKVVAPTKGELLRVSIPGFNQTEVINGQVYVAPVGNDIYVCGATFNPAKSDEEITDAGKEELIRKLKTITTLPFEVIDHFAGVRPAGRDRKPVLGRSRNNRNFSIFNGFGSKAVLYSPFLAQMLADHLENGTELAPEINIARFKVY